MDIKYVKKLLHKSEIELESDNVELIKLRKYFKCLRETDSDKCPEEPSRIMISTISASCTISRILNIPLLRSEFDNKMIEDPTYFIVSMAELRKKRSGLKEMSNSVRVKMRARPSGKIITILLFRNGRMTITGANSAEYGLKSAERLLEEIQKYPAVYYDVDSTLLKVNDYTVTLINAGFCVNFIINQFRFYEILINQYKMFVTFNQELYQGLKVTFAWNTSSAEKDGVCRCSKTCITRRGNNGTGNGEGDCRTITVAIFQSGEVLITGSASLDQMCDIYDIFIGIIRKHYCDIVTISICDMNEYE